jgi:hypothetical protein
MAVINFIICVLRNLGSVHLFAIIPMAASSKECMEHAMECRCAGRATPEKAPESPSRGDQNEATPGRKLATSLRMCRLLSRCER